ncbi:MAG: cob(I)yrinic acid a,c-diamide adenosyltransferase [Paramuribaculum sp.]|nr:cob(I)yrinic acid a,c-diamide adenosyltransferase [Paramuribaculum sp.]
MKKSVLYTATGDKGTTSLVGGHRISKADKRIQAYGDVDELNSYIGLIAALMAPADTMIHDELIALQHRLFDIGAALATLPDSQADIPAGVTQRQIEILERAIDRIDGNLPPLHNFILPGGTVASSHAQIARAVCRRAERNIAFLAIDQPVSPLILVFVNRLSDYLFALARYLNVTASHPEITWSKNG